MSVRYHPCTERNAPVILPLTGKQKRNGKQ